MVVGDTFSPLPPVLGSEQKKLALSPSLTFPKLAISRSSTVRGGPYDAKYVTFEYIVQAAFVGDIIFTSFNLNQLVYLV